MKFSFLAAALFFTGILFGQIITPAYVISNGAKGIKSVITEERSEYKDFRITSVVSYSRHGFVTGGMEFLITGGIAEYAYTYDINEDDSTIVVHKETTSLEGEMSLEIYNYLFSKGSLWESKLSKGNVTDYKQYQYDENWNLIAMNEIKLIGGDTNIVKRHRYSAQTDVFHRLVSSSQSEMGTHTEYYHDENGLLLSTAIFDGPVKRTTEHRVYNEDGLIELTMEVLNRGGNLMGIKRYSYDTYSKGKPSIFEKWMPLQNPESVMQER